MNIIRSTLNNWRFFIPFKKRVGYIGWIGYGNLGDEAMYVAFKKLFSSFNVLPFKYTEKFKIVEKVERSKFFNAICLGGGTLIGSVDSLRYLKIAQKNYKPSFIFGTGVRNPLFWDRVSPSSNCLSEWIECIKKCEYIGIRGPLSKQILNKYGLENIEVIGDAALLLAQNTMQKKDREKQLGINIGVSKGFVWGDEGKILDFVVKFSKIMLQKGWKITFLPVRQEDVPYIIEAVKKIGAPVSIFNEYRSVNKTIDFLKKCDLFVGEKLHSVILAMCAYTPSIMLEYRPKCLDFMASMDLEEFNIRTDKLSMDSILGLVDRLYYNLDFFQHKIYENANYFKRLQESKADFIIKTLLDKTI